MSVYYLSVCRRQYEVHKVEKAVRQTCDQRHMSRCLLAWRGVIRRKHTARDFHDSHLVRRVWQVWSGKTRHQVHEKQLQKMERVGGI